MKVKMIVAPVAGACRGCIFEDVKLFHHIEGAGCCADYRCTPSDHRDGRARIVVIQSDKARVTDPTTSHAAAEASKPKRMSLRERILIAMNGGHYEPRPQGWTGHELAEHLKVPLNSITPRFKELVDEGKIKDSGERRERQIVWVLV
jgi:hypothetical protein